MRRSCSAHREITDDSGLEVFSEQSPLGKAINGKKVGAKASYKAPNGKTIQVTVQGGDAVRRLTPPD